MAQVFGVSEEHHRRVRSHYSEAGPESVEDLAGLYLLQAEVGLGLQHLTAVNEAVGLVVVNAVQCL